MSENFFGDRGFYARRARAYDAMLGSPTYNRICWGTRPDQYAAFAARAIGSGDGPLLEVAVGTARATALLHVAGRRPTTLVDLSAPMLEVARESIRRAAGGEVPGRIALECRDMLSPPDGRRYETILGLGLLHLVPDVGAVISGLGDQLQEHGSLRLASLVRGSARSNAYLKLLKAHGDIAGIRTAAELRDLAVAAGVGNVSVDREGAMAYVTISR
ncbi:methyltransferase domain-containing protein [Paeniglutamicibacter sp. NPDC091659]|uniref:methyltransferase domain-containing protein n=1 Tax=Paeniglutamicibacter sp. NPDC091659 TaxID=3364389 RepID=UPI0037F62D4F